MRAVYALAVKADATSLIVLVGLVAEREGMARMKPIGYVTVRAIVTERAKALSGTASDRLAADDERTRLTRTRSSA
jgi:hypothetical protein